MPRVGAIIVGSSQREERLDVLERRMKETRVLNPESYWWYLDPATLRNCIARGVRPGPGADERCNS